MSEDAISLQIKNQIADVVNEFLLNGYSKAKVTLRKDKKLRGATDAIFYKVITSLEFVVKFHLRDGILDKNGYSLLSSYSKNLARHLVPPLFATEINPAIVFTPYINSVSLHEIVYKGLATDDWILKGLYEDFLSEIENLWKRSLTNSKPDLKNIYLRRLNDRARIIEDFWDLNNIRETEFIINGKSAGKFNDILLFLENRLTEIQKRINYSCSVHGDEHAKNILVKKDEINFNKKAWALIDYVNARKNWDWVFSIAKILHWWQLYYFIDCEIERKAKSLHGNTIRINRESNKIRVSYDQSIYKKKNPKVYNLLCNRVLKFSEDVNRKIFKEPPNNYRERLKIALFITYFGSISRHLEKRKSFAIPLLIGKAFEVFDEI